MGVFYETVQTVSTLTVMSPEVEDMSEFPDRHSSIGTESTEPLVVDCISPFIVAVAVQLHVISSSPESSSLEQETIGTNSKRRSSFFIISNLSIQCTKLFLKLVFYKAAKLILA